MWDFLQSGRNFAPIYKVKTKKIQVFFREFMYLGPKFFQRLPENWADLSENRDFLHTLNENRDLMKSILQEDYHGK